jgi:hypothetical protein
LRPEGALEAPIDTRPKEEQDDENLRRSQQFNAFIRKCKDGVPAAEMEPPLPLDQALDIAFADYHI